MKSLVNDIGKKKLIVIAGAFVGFIVLIIVILLIIHAVSGKSMSYKQIENKLLNAAKSYYEKNKDLLPQKDGEETTVDDVTLSAADAMKPLSEYTSDKEGVTCSGKVIVSYTNEKYRYTPLLDCGDSYKTETLTSHIISKEPKVFEGEGLYELNGELVYRGENPNNFVKFSGKLYRIVKIVDKNKAVLILEDRFIRGEWDDRYNVDRNSHEGISDYSISRIKTTLKGVLDDNSLVGEKERALLAKHDLYIGNRSESDNYNDGSIEKSSLDKDQYIGLLPLYDYLNASIDNLCQSAETKNCSNYNYLNSYNHDWWLLTGNSAYSYKIYRITAGEVKSTRASSNYYIRPVIMLNDSTLFAGGTGTSEDPYLVK